MTERLKQAEDEPSGLVQKPVGWLRLAAAQPGRAAHNPALRALSHRLAMGVLLLFVVSILSFVLVSVSPGDPTQQILGMNSTKDEYLALRTQLGFDQPVSEQYWHWLQNALTGDLGSSIFDHTPVTDSIGQRLPVTLSVMLSALVLSVAVGTTLGVVGAIRGGATDRAIDVFAWTAFSMPTYWVGAVLISVVAVKLKFLPATGYVPITESPVDWVRSMTLPVAALSLGAIAGIARQTREAMLDVLGSEYIRMARASGLSRPAIHFRHALKNAGIRVITVSGILAVGLLSGTILVEVVFALPGLGSLAVDATAQHDLPVVQGIVVFITAMVVVINLAVDVAYAWLNPRVRDHG